MKRLLFVFITAVIFIIFSPSAKAASYESLLILNEPKDNLMTTSDSIVVSGETLPDASISVLVNGSSKARLSVGAAGIFLIQVPLSGKENIITVRAVFPSGTKETVSRRVYKIDSGSEWPELDSLIQTIRTFLILK
ncbi:MAG: hypothetical protein PWR06_2106 [Thermoanaerobacteraceae bacterium]|jgi:archaellum component FlaG (FlaF/FlaG flagellin family)|uniref:Carboxypeptidase regulatory-like domain-containing protein n=1 Tax=Biomaibacter acetigenes TaxID=2316383 RepID=A0A3G2R9A2_9FIRM|nr:hypothetical protein [Biomaibacter acetigenes]MDK2879390.1 hypothetical protein [Thermoanaerobacteraceae bacterium]RKL62822.1 hypothetical protein DXT63_09445 [Thermoanaerobacteraceae bacterium SP2]AYO32060.1 hypothetical protein D2962_16930 [Biomaibacter acetigenes]MDN5301468.1 hypothetical protein [Thermoanaerobacteraceae bacterium]MDN5312093.1 hypothetical protein [Thermoanaerobacteraceae bacterium]